MNIDIKKAKQDELLCYQIALLQVQLNCKQQLDRIQIKLNKLKKESEKK